MGIKCILMNKNMPVMQIVGDLSTVGNSCFPTFVATQCDFLNKKLAPPAVFSANVEKRITQFNQWFSKRCVSKGRVIPIDSKRARWDKYKPHFFSMTDQYWLQYDKAERWDDLNFFTNDYSYATGDALLSKSLDWLETVPLCNNSPDITTNGVMNKRWIRDSSGKNILLKTSSDNVLQESKSEILATKFLENYGRVPYVTYYPYIYNYSMCCACRNFVSEDLEFITAGNLFYTVKMTDETKKAEDKVYRHLLNVISTYKIPGAVLFLEEMTIVDRMMVNQDRHLGNFGFLRNVNTGEYIGPAPLFDFGNAYFPDSTVSRSQYFFTLEKDLAYNDRIIPQDIEKFNAMLEDVGISDEEEKGKLLKLMENNNKFVQSLRNGDGARSHKEQEANIIL